MELLLGLSYTDHNGNQELAFLKPQQRYRIPARLGDPTKPGRGDDPGYFLTPQGMEEALVEPAGSSAVYVQGKKVERRMVARGGDELRCEGASFRIRHLPGLAPLPPPPPPPPRPSKEEPAPRSSAHDHQDALRAEIKARRAAEDRLVQTEEQLRMERQDRLLAEERLRLLQLKRDEEHQIHGDLLTRLAKVERERDESRKELQERDSRLADQAQVAAEDRERMRSEHAQTLRHERAERSRTERALQAELQLERERRRGVESAHEPCEPERRNLADQVQILQQQLDERDGTITRLQQQHYQHRGAVEHLDQLAKHQDMGLLRIWRKDWTQKFDQVARKLSEARTVAEELLARGHGGPVEAELRRLLEVLIADPNPTETMRNDIEKLLKSYTDLLAAHSLLCEGRSERQGGRP